MLLNEVVLLCLNIAFVFALQHEKPVHLTLWPGRCTKGSVILNDCNWCWCDVNQKYACKARVCHEVDMFGHFNDAIRDINVGMEGHAVWRSTKTACEPLVQYERGSLLCICGEDGNWPNPVCRDMFRVLHEVDISKRNQPLRRQKCSPTKLYLLGCNVCFCPSSELIDPDLCTTRNCTDDDILFDNAKSIERMRDDPSVEIYAECKLNRKYKFGCRSCMCLSNNRLVCDKCTITDPDVRKATSASYCDNVAPGHVFNIDCNLCVCDKKDLLYCTSKRCLGVSKYFDLTKLRTTDLISVDNPFDDLDCNPGTTYMKDCNRCYCSKTDSGQIYYSCTLTQCMKRLNSLSIVRTDCVEDTVYESSCQICQCQINNGVKTETCHIDPKCTGVKALKESRSLDINSMHGYCEPGHTYQKGCNTCRCLPDGRVLMCTPHICDKRYKEPITVDIIPVRQRDGSPCPKDHMYKVDCNVCFCLTNGNVLCTTADCSKNKK